MSQVTKVLKNTSIRSFVLLSVFIVGCSACNFLSKEHTIYEMRVEGADDYKVAVTCRSDDISSYFMYVVATRSGIEVGRSAMPIKGLDVLSECTEQYAVKSISLEERNTKARIQFNSGEVMEVPVSFMHYPPGK